MASSLSHLHPNPTLLLIISILYIIINGHFAQPPSHICPPFDCGNGVVIRYPLWHYHSQRQFEHCGYQGLNFTCNNQNPALNISNNLYSIKSINYSDNSLIISYSNQIKEPKCPKIPNNVTTNKFPLLFNYTYSNKMLSFFYNCTLYPPSQQDMTCLRFGAMRSFVFRALAIPEFDWHKYCESTVTVPVLGDDDEKLLLASSLGRALAAGFKLTWRAPAAAGECHACEALDSNGFCGYSTNGTGGQEFFCICPDGRHSLSCYGEGVVTVVPNYINIGALTVGGLIIVATVSYFINKKRAASYKPISQK